MKKIRQVSDEFQEKITALTAKFYQKRKVKHWDYYRIFKVQVRFRKQGKKSGSDTILNESMFRVKVVDNDQEKSYRHQ